MADLQGNANWLTLDQEAVLVAGDRLRAPGIRAEHATGRRALARYYSGAPATTERRQIDAASCHLRFLCTMGVTSRCP